MFTSQFHHLRFSDDSIIRWPRLTSKCDTFLCLDCDKHHSRNKSSKQHKTLPSYDFKKLPDFIIKTGNRCPDHDQRYELYCPNHSDACCLQCFTEKHQNCKDLKRLPDILSDIKSSTSMTRLENDLRDAKENCESIVIYLKGRLSTILKQKTNAIEQIHVIRTSLNVHLDKLEQRMLMELDSQHTKLKTKTEKLIDQIETQLSNLKHLHEDNEQMKNYATGLQTFIGLKKIAKMTTEEVGNLQKLTQSGELDELHMELTCFGSVSVTLVPCSLELKKEVECQVPISVTTVKTINDISPVLRQKIKLPNTTTNYNITGCQILPNGHLLFVDHDNKQLIQCNNKGNDIERVMVFRGKPYCVCYIKDNTVAVTVPDRHQIVKIDLVSEEITTTIRRGVAVHSYGIDSNGECIIVAESFGFNKNIVSILDLDGKVVRCVDMKGELDFVAMFENKLYSTNWETSMVLCMEENGNKLWEIDTKKLETQIGNKEFNQPMGIAIDNNQFIYVAWKTNNTIIIISPNGLSSRLLLSEADGIKNPTDISVDRETQTLLVSNRSDGCAFVFKI
ncbi:unnamed protein product [Mytilus coruscus]|uniref:B box-type domain-containing protein n=1 Tax=Mytilus coruscus TaxID=42192 RepID=A0A6J8BCM3_MYTCO|nr:unnamed protein product [Mytilus coruscus]